ncbi:MAG: TldD/PmbA family protein [Thermoprotei archaeon]
MRELLHELFEKIFRKAREKGIEELEFYARWSRGIETKVSRSRVKSITDALRVEYGVFGAIGKKTGSISSEDLNVDVDKLVDMLVSIIKASREDEKWSGFARNYGKGPEAPGYDKKIAEIAHEEVVDITRNAIETAIDAAKQGGAEEVIVSEGGYSAGIGGVFIANSYGEEQYGEYTINSISFEIKSRKAGEESSYWIWSGNRRLDLDEIISEVRRGGEYSVKFVGAKPVESGEYEVLLDPYMAGLFISTVLAPAFSALEVQEKRSPLAGKIGSQILSKNISIKDDPAIPWGLGTRPFDDEGIATTRKNLVEKGILKTYLYNYYTARREGRDSTGNGIRRTAGSPATPAPTNMVLECSGILASFDDMVREIKRGIIVHGMIGYWMSNPVNGSTQATVSHGLYVENGEVKKPVKGVVIGGNIYEWLGKSLVLVSKEVKKVGNIYAPAILVRGVRVAG